MFQTWPIDFAGPLTVTSRRSKYLLIGVEHVSGWPVATAVSARYFNSRGFLHFVDKEIITAYGNPIFMLSDNDSKFTSGPVRDYAKENSTKWKYISTYNLRGNAKVERMVGTIKRAIKKVILSTNKQWDQCIDEVLRGYQCRPGPDGMSPLEMMFGIRPSIAHEPPHVMIH